LILSRQNLPVLEGTAGTDGVARGAYTLVDSEGAPDVVLIGTGSEVSVCVAAAETLGERGVKARVVSMPCWSLFDAQPDDYRAAVLPHDVARVSIEAGVTLGWARYADLSIGIERFGESAPGDVVLDKLGMNPTNLVDQTLALLESRRTSR
jgi:transketolase